MLFSSYRSVFLALAVAAQASASNVVVWWGQNSANQHGAQQPLRNYCDNPDIGTLVISFAYTFSGPNKIPILNLADACEDTFPNSNQLSCPAIGDDIKHCQSVGKRVLLGIGGAAGDYSLNSAGDAQSAAFQVYNGFFDGHDGTCLRPFGDAVLDGVNLDLEGGQGTYWPNFINSFNQLAGGKHYLMTGAPQCPFPDYYLKPAMDASYFDEMYIQFYNNYCSIGSGNYNFADWDNWAKTSSKNSNVKLFVAVPADPGAAGSGYKSVADISSGTAASRQSSNFGGYAVWDASRAPSDFLHGLHSIGGATASSKYTLEHPLGQSKGGSKARRTHARDVRIIA